MLNKYRIFETSEFLKKIEKVTKSDLVFIKKKLAEYVYSQLKEEPHLGNNIKKLVNYSPETCRYRIGKYRLFYVINEEEKIVFILSVDQRKDAY